MKFTMPRTGEVFERLWSDPKWSLFKCPECYREWWRKAAADRCFLCKGEPAGIRFGSPPAPGSASFDPAKYAAAKGRSSLKG